MDANRRAAVIVGVLLIVGTLAGVLSAVVTNPILSASDFLASIAANANQLVIGALLMLAMGLSLAMVPVVMYPISRRYS